MHTKSPARHLLTTGYWLLATLLFSACGPAISKDQHNSFLTSDDLTEMTDKMAAAVASSPQVAQVTQQQHSPMVIVMKPIINDTNEIIVGNEKELYVARVRGLLASKPALRSQFVFVMNLQDYTKLLNAEGVSSDQLGPVEAASAAQNRYVPQYALTGRFFAQTNASSQQRSDFYLCTYQLTNIANGLILWEGTYETKKTIKRSMLD